MVALVIAIHLVVCVVLTVVVLLQKGKGADIGAVFGGSSQTVFGSSGAGNFLTKLTAGLAVVFFTTSIFLAYASTRQMTASIFERSSLPRTHAPLKPVPGGRPAVPAPGAPARK